MGKTGNQGERPRGLILMMLDTVMRRLGGGPFLYHNCMTLVTSLTLVHCQISNTLEANSPGTIINWEQENRRKVG